MSDQQPAPTDNTIAAQPAEQPQAQAVPQAQPYPQQYPPAQQYPQQYPVGAQYAVPVVVASPGPPRGFSIASMVLALVSIVFGFTFILPLIAFILGIVGLRREPAGRGMAVTGLILSGIFLLGWTLLLVALGSIGIFGAAWFAAAV